MILNTMQLIDRNLKISDKSLLLLISSIFLQSFSFLSIKFSTMQENIYALILLVLAFFFLGSRAIVWQMLLKHTELSKIYPFASLVQVLILIYSVVIFNENVTINNIIGLLIMLSGIYYISRKDIA